MPQTTAQDGECAITPSRHGLLILGGAVLKQSGAAGGMLAAPFQFQLFRGHPSLPVVRFIIEDSSAVTATCARDG